jgi:hypothetical protein
VRHRNDKDMADDILRPCSDVAGYSVDMLQHTYRYSPA